MRQTYYTAFTSAAEMLETDGILPILEEDVGDGGNYEEEVVRRHLNTDCFSAEPSPFEFLDDCELLQMYFEQGYTLIRVVSVDGDKITLRKYLE